MGCVLKFVPCYICLFVCMYVLFTHKHDITLIRTHTGVYVPLGGKKLLNFMDDFNMPAKDTFGSQPPLELIRHWIDYGFWYDRQRQTVKQIKVGLCAQLNA